jgi:hypothetical protein
MNSNQNEASSFMTDFSDSLKAALKKQEKKETNNTLNTSNHYTAHAINSNQNEASSFVADFSESLKAALKKQKKTAKTDKKDKKERKEKKKKDKETKATERSSREEKLPKVQEGDSMTSLDFNASSLGLDASSKSGGLDYTRFEREHGESDIAHQLRTMKVEEEHKRKREERRRKRDEAKMKSMLEVDVEDLEESRIFERLELVFLWYTRMGTPSRKAFERQIATQEWIDITAEDVDLLSWNETGTRVMDVGVGPCSYA